MTYGSWWSKKWNTPSRTKDIFFITKHDLSCGQLSCILALFCFVLVFFFFFFSLYKTQYDEWKFVHVCVCVFFGWNWIKMPFGYPWKGESWWRKMIYIYIYIERERERERDACKSHISFPKFEISTLFNWRRFRGTSSVGSSCGAQNPFG